MTALAMKPRHIMIRRLMLLILLASCQGCMMFDDLAYYDRPMPPPSSCGVAAPVIQQTAEPELLRR